MRITCPNCGAQYEVDDALIPEAGRDVQCSNCGKGWFQPKHPEPAMAESEPETKAGHEEADVAEAAPDDEDERAAEIAEPAAPEPVAAAETDAEVAPPEREDDRRSAPIDSEDEDDEDEPLASAPAVAPRKPDESVLSVLREEAEREIAQRRQDAGAIESQPDLGLSELPQRRTGPSEADIAAGAAVAASARRDLLPDIDEINSTLRPDAVRGPAAGGETEIPVEDGRRRGFRMGFGLMLLLAAVLIGLYIAAGWLAAAVPALEPFLIGYVETANAFRAWIDGLLASGVDAMSG
jgi:predicted Zn finger-like uncharacterized protein